MMYLQAFPYFLFVPFIICRKIKKRSAKVDIPGKNHLWENNLKLLIVIRVR